MSEHDDQAEDARDLDSRLAGLPVAEVGGLLVTLRDRPDAADVLIDVLDLVDADGAFSSMVRLAVEEQRDFGSDPTEVLSTVQAALRLVGTPGEGPVSLTARLEALRPNRKAASHGS